MSLLDPIPGVALPDLDATLAQVRLRVDALPTMSLVDLEQVSLMNRVDTKFIFDVAELAGVLGELDDGYSVLEVAGTTVHRYDNQYFDTSGFACYLDHHNADFPRYKFRYRHYVDSDRVFFEVKKKTNQGRTVKDRIPVAAMSTTLDEAARARVAAVAGDRGWNADELVPSVRGSFRRISIGHLDLAERATIDIGLSVSLGGETSAFDGVAICELKQSTFSRVSPLAEALKRRGVRTHRMTKYCLGVLSSRPDVKANDFKPMVREIVGVATSA